MRKFILSLLSITVFFYSCTDKEIPDGIETLNKKVNFLPRLKDIQESASTRSQAGFDPSTGIPYVSKFVFYAFRENSTQTYVLEKIVRDASDPDALLGSDDMWATNNESSLLPVGKYKFIALYNLGTAGSNSGLVEEMAIGTQLDAAKKILCKHTDTGTDINEIFYGIKENPVSIGADNEAVVSIELTRVVSRIDIKFIKLSSDGTVEIPYQGGSIFGETVSSSTNINGIGMSLIGLPSALSLDKTTNGSGGTLNCNYSALLPDKLVIGTSSAASTYPGADYNFDALPEVITRGIISGGAYLKGAYVLPFSSADDKMQRIVLTLEPKNQSKYESRTITIDASGALSLQSNYVTLITVKLISTTDSLHPENGDDDEHLFNPKTRLTVSVDTRWGGCIDVPVEVH